MSRWVVPVPIENWAAFLTIMRNKKQTYSDLLRDPRWQKKRLEIMQRDNFTCQHCGAQDKELQVHHMLYTKGAKPWEYNERHLITLCRQCHEVESEENKRLYNLFCEVKEGFSARGISSELLCCILDSLVYSINGTYQNERNEGVVRIPSDELIKDACYGSQNLSDAISLSKIGIDCSELIKVNYPDFVTRFEKAIKNK